MAHNIEQVNGRAALAIAKGKPAWHRLGAEIHGAESVVDICTIAGMNWSPIEQRLFCDRIPLDIKAIRKSTDGKVVGVNALSYSTFSHVDHLNQAYPVVSDKLGTWDCVGSLYDGSVYFGSIALGTSEPLPGDAYNRYLLVAGSYDGSHRAAIGLVTTRTVCANTLAVSFRQAGLKTRHKGNVGERMGVAAQVIDTAIRTLDAHDTRLAALAKLKMSDEQFKAMVQKLYPKQKTPAKKVVPMLKDLSTGSALLDDLLAQPNAIRGVGSLTSELLAAQEADERNRSVEILTELYHTAPGARPGTAYGALQAVTYWETHGKGRKDESRFESTAMGNGERLLELVELSVQAN